MNNQGGKKQNKTNNQKILPQNEDSKRGLLMGLVMEMRKLERNGHDRKGCKMAMVQPT